MRSRTAAFHSADIDALNVSELPPPPGGEFLPEWLDEDPPESISQLRKRYEQLQLRTSPEGQEKWLNWILRLRDSRSVIGYVQATVRGDRASVAYVVFSNVPRMGYGKEAVAAMLAELQICYGVSEFGASVESENHSSLSLLKHLGFLQSETEGNEVLLNWKV